MYFACSTHVFWLVWLGKRARCRSRAAPGGDHKPAEIKSNSSAPQLLLQPRAATLQKRPPSTRDRRCLNSSQATTRLTCGSWREFACCNARRRPCTKPPQPPNRVCEKTKHPTSTATPGTYRGRQHGRQTGAAVKPREASEPLRYGDDSPQRGRERWLISSRSLPFSANTRVCHSALRRYLRRSEATHNPSIALRYARRQHTQDTVQRLGPTTHIIHSPRTQRSKHASSCTQTVQRYQATLVRADSAHPCAGVG